MQDASTFLYVGIEDIEVGMDETVEREEKVYRFVFDRESFAVVQMDGHSTFDVVR
jgi:hypothetical protein